MTVDPAERLLELLHYWLEERERTDERAMRVLGKVDELLERLPAAPRTRWGLVFHALVRELPPGAPAEATPRSA